MTSTNGDAAKEALRARHMVAVHGIQSGVAFELAMDPSNGTSKHLRVGINCAMCDQTALVRLLVKKGFITEREYFEAICEEAEAEVARYEARLSEMYGAKIKLA